MNRSWFATSNWSGYDINFFIHDLRLSRKRINYELPIPLSFNSWSIFSKDSSTPSTVWRLGASSSEVEECVFGFSLFSSTSFQFGSAFLIDKFTLLFSISNSVILILTFWPKASASSGESTLSEDISDTWTKPSTPLPIVTNAPNGTTLVTSPSTMSSSL